MKILKKLFIKNYRNTSDPKVHHRYGVVAGVIGIIFNLLIFGCGIAVGLISSSISIIIQSVANLTDAGSSVITLIGFKLSSKPADKDHPFGHARIEHIAGFIITIIMLMVGALFAKSSIEKIITPEELNINTATYIVLGFMVAIKLLLMLMYRSFAKDIDSDTLLTSSVDARNDMLANIAILISMIVMNIFDINIDGYVGLAVAIITIISAIKMIGETVDPLISVKPNRKLVNKIKRELLSFEGINDMHDLLIHTYGTGSTFVSVHVEVHENTSLLDCHELIDTIERYFEDKLKINLTMQVDPVNPDNPENKRIQSKMQRALRTLNKKITIHGLRVVRSQTKTTVLFDILEDFDSHLTKKQINSVLAGVFDNENTQFEFIFTIDKPFT
ncbi:MAG: cation transporter [Clostridiales bacterium]|nr:cation transporter [Clostridiales bacterium]